MARAQHSGRRRSGTIAPPPPFGTARDNPDSFLKAVGRVLEKLSEMPGGPVIKREEGYLLTEGNAG